MDKELVCPSCNAKLHLVDEVELQVVPEVAVIVDPVALEDKAPEATDPEAQPAA